MTTGTSHTKAKRRRRRRNEAWEKGRRFDESQDLGPKLLALSSKLLALSSFYGQMCEAAKTVFMRLSKRHPGFEVDMYQPLPSEDDGIIRVNIRHGDSELDARMREEKGDGNVG